MDWSLAALHVYMPDWPMALAKIAKAATKALCLAPQVRSEIGKRQDLTPLLRPLPFMLISHQAER